MTTIGPFEYKNFNLTLLTVSENVLYLITLDILSSFKYYISLQIPFLFSGHIDDLKSRSLEELKARFHCKQINADKSLTVIIEENNKWKNAIILNDECLYERLLIQERYETENYKVLLKNLYSDKINIVTK